MLIIHLLTNIKNELRYKRVAVVNINVIKSFISFCKLLRAISYFNFASFFHLSSFLFAFFTFLLMHNFVWILICIIIKLSMYKIFEMRSFAFWIKLCMRWQKLGSIWAYPNLIKNEFSFNFQFETYSLSTCFSITIMLNHIFWRWTTVA